MDLKITKRNREQLPFIPDKYIRSLKRCGADDKLAQDLCQEIERDAHDEMSSRTLFNRTRSKLRRRHPLLYTNYGLSQALLRLGPEGHCFERFMASYFRRQGMTTEVGVIRDGRCIKHEVDVIAKNEQKSIFVECKFHNRRGHKNDIKVALYVRARQLDLAENKANKVDEFWLISNTKFSQDAIDYARCAGLYLVGSNTPNGQNLLQMIQQSRHYPITILSRLHERQLHILQGAGVLLLKDLIEQPDKLNLLKLSPAQQYKIERDLELMKLALLPESTGKKS